MGYVMMKITTTIAIMMVVTVVAGSILMFHIALTVSVIMASICKIFELGFQND
jgi:hypothetical protein